MSFSPLKSVTTPKVDIQSIVGGTANETVVSSASCSTSSADNAAPLTSAASTSAADNALCLTLSASTSVADYASHLTRAADSGALTFTTAAAAIGGLGGVSNNVSGAMYHVPASASNVSTFGTTNANFGRTAPSSSTGLGGLPPNYNNNLGGTMVPPASSYSSAAGTTNLNFG